MKVALKLSFREVIIQASQCFCHLPHYSTLYYRAQKLNNTELQTLITSVAEEIMSTLNSKHLELVMADGTGFGYKDTVTLSFKRGQELRKVKSHVMTEVLVDVNLIDEDVKINKGTNGRFSKQTAMS